MGATKQYIDMARNGISSAAPRQLIPKVSRFLALFLAFFARFRRSVVRGGFVALTIAVCVLNTGSPVLAAEPIRIGVLAFRPKPQTLEQWAPLGPALSKAIPGHRFVVEAYALDELQAAVADRKIDFILTNPGHYVLMNRRIGLSPPIATLSNLAQGQPATTFGGVIFTRSNQTEVNQIKDITGHSVAATGIDSLGGYQMQAYLLARAGIDVSRDIRLMSTGMPHDNVVDTVLGGRANVGFVRSGVLEKLAAEGRLNLADIKIINRQQHHDFPLLASTGLYPEWPFAALPQTDKDLKRKVSSYLLNLAENKPLAQALQIHGFDVPADYSSVEEVLRELRMPPFEKPISFTLHDVWDRFRWPIVAGLVASLLILLLGIRVLMSNRRLRESELSFRTVANYTHDWEYWLGPNDEVFFMSPSCERVTGYSADEFVANHNLLKEIVFSEDKHLMEQHLQGVHQHKGVEKVVFRVVRRDGRVVWIEHICQAVYDSAGQYIGRRVANRDITDRKLAETRSMASEVRLRTIIESEPECIKIVDGSGLLLEMNPAGLEMLEAESLNQLAHKPVLNLIAPQYRDAYAEMHKRVMNGECMQMEYEVLGLKGGHRWVETHAVPMKDSDGKVVNLAVTRDITKRKQAEEQVQALLREQRAMLETDLVGIAKVKDRGIVWANPAYEKMLGYERGELSGTPARMHYVSEEDYTAVGMMAYPILASGKIYRTQIKHRRKDGVVIWIEMSCTMLNAEAGESMWTFVDITNRKEAEEKLRSASIYSRSLIEASLDPLVTISADGKVMDVNRATERVTGRSRDELIGSDFCNYFTEPEKARLGYQQAFADGQVTDYPLAIVNKTGDVTGVLYNASVYRDEQGNIKGVFAAARDVTEQSKAQQAISEAKEMAERMAKIRSEFLANMSHEIRTPMNGIIGLSQLALNQKTSPQVRDYLHKISSSSQSLLGILNDILDFSKMEAGRMSIESGVFDLDQLVDNLRNLFSENAESKHLDFLIEVADGTPRDLVGDALRIQQILSNLIGNAIKFTERGHVALKICVNDMEGSLARVGFLVEDTGIGIAAEDLGKLFQPFSQVDGTITRRFGGTGLGLVISNKLLELMGGEFKVTSHYGQGTVFSFELLLGVGVTHQGVRKTRHRARHEEGDLSHELKVKGDALQGARVLVAEDNKINQQVVKEFLKLSGIEVEIANDGQEAINLIHQGDFDAILMDVHMPVMGGVEATRLIRAESQYAQLPIIALTAGVTAEERESCLACGMSDFVAKPVNPGSLIAILSKWITPRIKGVEPQPRVSRSVEWSDIEQLLLGFDLTTLKTMIGGRADLLVRMMRSFLADFSAEAAVIVAHIDKGEIDLAEKALHRLKGAAGSLGAIELHEASEKLDAQLKQGRYGADTLSQWLKVFDATMASLEGALASSEGSAAMSNDLTQG